MTEDTSGCYKIIRHFLEHKPLSDVFEIFDNILTGLQWPFDVFESFLCTGVTFVSFSKDGNVDCAIESFRLVKIKSTNKSDLFLISLALKG